jgi:hypothetical protein
MIMLLTDFELWQESEIRAVAGGSYFNPTAELASSGRELVVLNPVITGMNLRSIGRPTFFVSKVFSELISYLALDEAIFGLYLRGRYQLAPLLSDAADLMTYESQVSADIMSCLGYYALPNATADLGLARSL